MSKDKIYNELAYKLQQEHVFWSFDKVNPSAISNKILISKVLLHLDIYDIKLLLNCFLKKYSASLETENAIARTPVSWIKQIICISFF